MPVLHWLAVVALTASRGIWQQANALHRTSVFPVQAVDLSIKPKLVRHGLPAGGRHHRRG